MGGIGNQLPASLDSPNIGFTKEGGLWQKYINKTGAASVKGTTVTTGSDGGIDDSVDMVIADGDEVIGVIYDDGVADDSLIRVVTAGRAQVLLEDGTISTRGFWARTSITDPGRADITNADPPGGGVTEIDRHFREIGHCLESKGSGTDILAFVHLHFN